MAVLTDVKVSKRQHEGRAWGLGVLGLCFFYSVVSRPRSNCEGMNILVEPGKLVDQGRFHG